MLHIQRGAGDHYTQVRQARRVERWEQQGLVTRDPRNLEWNGHARMGRETATVSNRE